MEKRKLLVRPESLLGFGCMRFPTLEDGSIDRMQAFAMLDTAYAGGVTYYDTAFPYHAQQSEIMLGLWQETKPRESLRIATKMPVWLVQSAQEAQEIFQEQLCRLRVEHVDYYLLHALNAQRWEHVKKIGLLELLEQWKLEGKIGSIGFSFHDKYPVFEEILKAFPWNLCQLQLNYMDTHTQAGLQGYRLAETMGIPVIVMEPVKGGRLAKLPVSLEKRYREAHPDWSPSAWALRWASSLHHVAVVLSGMSSLEQVTENLDTFQEPWLAGEDLAVVHFVAKEIASRKAVACTGCRYCQPCPADVSISEVFDRYNDFVMYEIGEQAQRDYRGIGEKHQASACVNCGKCVTLCPQALEIPKLLRKAHEVLMEDAEDQK